MSTPQFSRFSPRFLLILTFVFQSCGPQSATGQRMEIPGINGSTDVNRTESASLPGDEVLCYDLHVSPSDPERLFSRANAFIFLKRGPVLYLSATPRGGALEAPRHLKRQLEGAESIYTRGSGYDSFRLSTSQASDESEADHDGEHFIPVSVIEEGDMGSFCLLSRSNRDILRSVSQE